MKIEIKEGKLKHVLEVEGSVENLRKELFATLGDSIPLDKMKLLVGGKFVNVEKVDGPLESVGLKDGAKVVLMWKDGYRRPEFTKAQQKAADGASNDTGGYAKDGVRKEKDDNAEKEPVG